MVVTFGSYSVVDLVVKGTGLFSAVLLLLCQKLNCSLYGGVGKTVKTWNDAQSNICITAFFCFAVLA